MLTIKHQQMATLNDIKKRDFFNICSKAILRDYVELANSIPERVLNEKVIEIGNRAMNEFYFKGEKWIYRFIVLSLKYKELEQRQYDKKLYTVLINKRMKSEMKINLINDILKNR